MRHLALIVLVALFVGIGIAHADSMVQQDSNMGFLHFATCTFVISPFSNAFTDILATGPASVTTYIASFPNGQYCVLPQYCRGFQLTAFNGDMIVGDPTDIATGGLYVGVLIASGTSMKWESRNAEQHRGMRMRIYMNGTTSGTLAICGWGGQ